jgi:ABC-2 type transport system permease protein
MKRVFKIARREYLAAVKRKGFIIGLAFAPLLMGGSFIAMALFNEQVNLSDQKIVIVDYTGQIADALVAAAEKRNRDEVFDDSGLSQVKPFFVMERMDPAGRNQDELRLGLSNRIRDRELRAFIEIPAGLLGEGPGGEVVRPRYFAANAALDEARSWFNQSINRIVRQDRLARAGVDSSNLDYLVAWHDLQPTELVSQGRDGLIGPATETSEGRAIGVPMGITFLMFMMVMMGAVPLLNAVMEEKTQGIAEVMLGSVGPFEFMMGKVLGGLGVSLTASTVYFAAGLLALTNIGFAGLIPFRILPWLVAFMLLEIMMMGSILASLGAACSDAKDAQNLTLPGLFPVMIPMFLLIPVLQEPNSPFSTWISFVPPFTPMLMVMRLSTAESVPGWQPWVGLLGVLLMTALAVWAGGRIFRVGILMQGQPPKLSTLLKWAFHG